MTVKELREKLMQYDDDMEVKVLDTFGYYDECNNILLMTTEDYLIDKDYIALESN